MSQEQPVVEIQTNKGSFRAELWPQQAPKTVENFLAYVEKDHYAGLIFHRVINGFMIQGGGMDPQMQPKATESPVENEACAEAPNKRGTLAMARTNDPHSATSQFFVNLVDNDFLDHKDDTPRGYGYCVFGQVVDGMDVVDEIAAVQTSRHGPYDDVPAEPVIIESVQRV
jgi:cyclophilin family peptidyl-prolyl cis-trans isomerase